MRALTLPRLLTGDEEAVRELASSPRPALVVGLLFVASAALAREYDGQYLVAEPQHLLVPFVASLAAAVVTFLVCWLALLRRVPAGAVRPAMAPRFVAWLTIFWWTAPLAWLYAVPWERVLSPADAAVANLLTLGLVAAWRVTILAYAGSVLLGAPMRTLVLLLLGVSAPVVIVALDSMALPLVAVMGGVRQIPESQRVVGELSQTLLMYSCAIGPLLTLTALIAVLRRGEPWTPLEPGPPAGGRGAWAVAGAALLAGVALLAVGQPEQARAHAVDVAVAQGRPQDALALLVAGAPDDFPPQWGVPPRDPRAPAQLDLLLELVEATRGASVPAWVRRAYAQALCAVDYGTWGPLAFGRPVPSAGQPREADPRARRTVRALASLAPEDVKGRPANPTLGWWLHALDASEAGDAAALETARALFGVSGAR